MGRRGPIELKLCQASLSGARTLVGVLSTPPGAPFRPPRPYLRLYHTISWNGTARGAVREGFYGILKAGFGFGVGQNLNATLSDIKSSLIKKGRFFSGWREKKSPLQSAARGLQGPGGRSEVKTNAAIGSGRPNYI